MKAQRMFQSFSFRETTRERVAEIEELVGKGMTHFDERCALYELASGYHHHNSDHGANLGYCIELGTFEGQSTVVLAKALQDIKTRFRPLFAIDFYRYGGRQIFDTEACRKARDKFHQSDTADDICQIIYDDLSFFRFWTLPARLIFYDSDHSYGVVKEGIYRLMAYLRLDGWLAIHDYNGKGVFDAVNEFLEEQKLYEVEVFGCEHLVCIHKKG